MKSSVGPAKLGSITFLSAYQSKKKIKQQSSKMSGLQRRSRTLDIVFDSSDS